MAQQHPTSTPIWHLAVVRQAAALAGYQKIGTGTWQDGQQVAFWQRAADQWVVFDGAETYFILTTEEAKHALTSCRDAKQKVRLADNQGGLTLNSYHTLQEHGLSFQQAARRRADVHDQTDSDLALMMEEQKLERQAEFHQLPGVSQGNWEDDHQPHWRS
jgi:hypothetical protein